MRTQLQFNEDNEKTNKLREKHKHGQKTHLTVEQNLTETHNTRENTRRILAGIYKQDHGNQ